MDHNNYKGLGKAIQWGLALAVGSALVALLLQAANMPQESNESVASIGLVSLIRISKIPETPTTYHLVFSLLPSAVWYAAA